LALGALVGSTAGLAVCIGLTFIREPMRALAFVLPAALFMVFGSDVWLFAMAGVLATRKTAAVLGALLLLTLCHVLGSSSMDLVLAPALLATGSLRLTVRPLTLTVLAMLPFLLDIAATRLDLSLAWPLACAGGCIYLFRRKFAPSFTCGKDTLGVWFLGPLVAGRADLSTFAHLALIALVLS
jgi:hypothetical protein